MKLSTLQQTLGELNMHPSKSLGQNFLHDQNLAAWIVDQLALTPQDALAEVGPGLGSLTEFALQKCGSATLIEKDGRLAAYLQERFGDRAEVVHQDALEYDARKLFPKGPVKLLGNLPYYVTSPLLFQFIAEPSPIVQMVLTVQSEFADRLAALPRTKAYGALTLIVGRRWVVKYLRKLPGSVFMPPPNVDSGVISLSPRPPGELPECDGDLFNRLVKKGFSQRRKQLRKMLAQEVADWPAFAGQLGIAETVRAEELSLEQWIALTNLIRPVSAAKAQDVHGEMFDLVDDNDQPLPHESGKGTRIASRHEVHSNKLKHRAVHIFVFNAKGELFLQKRSRWKDAHPSKWDSSASGHVNAGDDYAPTAVREVEEELGVQADVEFVGKIAACPNTGWEFAHLFQARHEGPFILPRAEIETGGFFPLEIVRRWVEARPEDFATGFIECWELFGGAPFR
jgi:16S rRNA (adenine1518-N6/adenine1519-N6)-dimethyltransferase